MRIYIDEAGAFLPPCTDPHSFSLVLALIIPSEIEAELFYEFLRLRDQWSERDIEIKGSSLDEAKSAAVIALLGRHDVLVEYIALDMAVHPKRIVDDIKCRQANAILQQITPKHQPGMIADLQKLSRDIGDMSNQLFLQAFVTMLLVVKTIRSGSLYFVQRIPKELGDIAWSIDRKDQKITQMEKTWSTLILPVSESQFGRDNLVCLRGADYSYFDARYGFPTIAADTEMKRHLEWLDEIYGTKSNRSVSDIKRLLTEQRVFDDSRNSLGLQLADMLATILRRAFNQRLQREGWENFGKLLVRKKKVSSSIIGIGERDGPVYVPDHATEVCRILQAKAKSMLRG